MAKAEVAIKPAAGPPEPFIAELRDLTDQYPTRELLWRQRCCATHLAVHRGPDHALPCLIHLYAKELS